MPFHSVPGVSVGLAPPTPSYNPFDDDNTNVAPAVSAFPPVAQPLFHSSPGFSNSHSISRSIPVSKPEVSPSVPPNPAHNLPTPSTFVDFDPFGLPPAVTASPAPSKPVKAPESVASKPAASPTKPVEPRIVSSLHSHSSTVKTTTTAVWVCARCTFENKLDTFPCEMCGYDDVLPADITTKSTPVAVATPSKPTPAPTGTTSPLHSIPDVHGNFLQRIKTGRWSRAWKPVYVHASRGKLCVFKSRDSFTKVALGACFCAAIL
jgi:hypothetical protein